MDKYYGKASKDSKDGSVDFNTAFSEDGFFMYVPKGVRMPYPIQLTCLMTSGADQLATGRSLIIIEDDAEAKLVDSIFAQKELKFLANRVTEIFVGKRAKYEHYKVENTKRDMTNLNHVFTIEAGTNNKIVGSSRGRISGTVKGSGNLTIETRYVRCDVGATFSEYEGTLTAQGSQFRLMENVTDMSKARLALAPGAYVAHFKSGSASEGTATLKIGSLTSSASATDAVLGGSGSTYEIGHLGENSTFYGMLKGVSVRKVGDGKLTLRTV